MRRVFLAILASTLFGSSPAGANGAFPDASQILLPADHPQTIAVGTNFGMVITDDGGATWTWTCEEVIGSFARLYQVGASPGDRVYALPPSGLVTSGDHGCSWPASTGSFDTINDAFPDPNDPSHVIAIAQGSLDGGTGFYLVESHDGGSSFDAVPKYVPPLTYSIDTIEIAAGAPQVVYTTMTDTVGKHVFLARSIDGAGSFQLSDVGTDPASIAAVDPNQPLRVYLRVQNPTGDALGITADGATVGLALHLTTPMTAFLRRADGTLLVAASNGTAFQSHDGGASWAPWAAGLHIRALGERSGVLYAAASDVADGFAVGSSTDDGATWKPLLRLRDIQGPQPCVWEACAVPWAKLKALIGSSSPVDGGDTADLSVTPEPPRPAGCSCNLGAAASPGVALLLVLASLIAALRLARRR